MPIAETLITTAAKTTIGKMISWGIKKFSQSNSNKYISELYQVIIDTCKEHEKKFPVEETEKIPFYYSLTIIEELIKFRFTKELDKNVVIKALDEDKRIIAPNQEELNTFLEIFSKNVNATPYLKELNIDFNYKEEIFNITENLKTFRNEFAKATDELKAILTSNTVFSELKEEWNYQLSEIHEDIKAFKARSALERLKKLESRINELSVSDNKIQSRLFYLISLCMDLMHRGITQEHALLLLKLHKLEPRNLKYKANAALGYFILKDTEKAQQFALEIIEEEEYNVTAWAILIFNSGSSYASKLQIVPKIIKESNDFVAFLFNWLFSNQHINTIHDFNTLNLDFKVDYDAPILISHRNIYYQTLLAEYLLHKFIERRLSFNSDLLDPIAQQDQDLHYVHQLYKKCANLIVGSEVEDNFKTCIFFHHYVSYIINRSSIDIHEMENAYKIIDKRNLQVAIKMFQAFNSSRDREGYLKAISVIDNYTGHTQGLLFLFKASNYALLGNKDEQTSSFVEYINSINQVDKSFFINFTQFSWKRNIKNSPELTSAIQRILSLTPMEPPELSGLLQLFCYYVFHIGDFNHEEIDVIIERTKQMADPKDPEFNLHIAMGYIHREKFEEARQYLEPNLDYQKPSDSLKLFCKILFKLDGNKIRLLGLLKTWRDSFHPDFELLQLELTLRNMQYDWTEAVAICQLGISIFNGADVFTHGFFMSLLMAKDFLKIKKNLNLIHNRTFSDEQHVINIANALLSAEAYEAARDMLFLHASNKRNKECRQAYLILSIKFPEGFFQQFKIVEIGHFVKYSIGDIISVIEITESNKLTSPSNYLIGKSIGSQFSAPGGIGSRFSEIRIERITDKFIALFDEITEEARNPLSGMSVQTFVVDPNNPAGLIDLLQETFGIENNLENQRTARELEAYHAGQITFTEITASVFKQNYLEAYFHLTNSGSKPFRSISKAINQAILSEETKCVADFTALLLLFELDNDQIIEFKSKLLISDATYLFIEELLDKTRTEPFPKMTISFNEQRVSRYIYEDDAQHNRINALENILKWIKLHCIIEKVEDSIEYLASLDAEHQHNKFMRCILENCTMANKEGYVLLTSDFFVVRQLGIKLDKILSPIVFLQSNYAEQKSEWVTYLLKKNYVGVPLTVPILKDEFLNFLSGKENKFTICLENLSFYWNPDNNNIIAGVGFVKDLYMTSIINAEKRSQIVLTIFQYLLKNMRNDHILYLTSVIEREFTLLPTQKTEVQMILLQVIKMR